MLRKLSTLYRLKMELQVYVILKRLAFLREEATWSFIFIKTKGFHLTE